MAPLIMFGISIFMIFGVFPITLMTYATLRDKKAAKAKSQQATPDAQ